MTGLGTTSTTVKVGAESIKIAGLYQGPALPNELCPFRHATRDHRGLDPWEAALFERAASRLGNLAFFGNQTGPLLGMLRNGTIPFAKCKNPLDGGKLWGRYFDVATNTVTTQRVPPKKCDRYDVVCKAVDFVDDVATWVIETVKTFRAIGGDLLQQFADIVADPGAFLDTVMEAFKLGLCAMLDAEWKRRLLQAGGIIAGLPPASSDLAIKICRALCAFLKIIEAALPNDVKAVAALVVTAEILL